MLVAESLRIYHSSGDEREFVAEKDARCHPENNALSVIHLRR